MEYQQLYLQKLEILQFTHLPPICSGGSTEEEIRSSTAEKRLVDEFSFHSNEGQLWQWIEQDKLALRPKRQGRGLMVSDFI